MEKWPGDMNIVQVRVARQTDKLEEVERFYCEGLGLEKVASFRNHDGYDGLMVGLPNREYHLEFIQHEEGSPGPAPSKENLLVLYMPEKPLIDSVAKRLHDMGYEEVSPENSYWIGKSVTIEDPDGWRVVLMNTNGI